MNRAGTIGAVYADNPITSKEMFMEYTPETLMRISFALGDVIQKNHRSLSVADRFALQEARLFLESQATKPLPTSEIIVAISSAISIALRVLGIRENL